MPKKQRLLFGTLLLTGAGLVTRLIGFFYRIFLSNAIGAEGMGIIQLIVPLLNLCYAFTVLGMQTALSKTIADHFARSDKQGARDSFFAGSILSLAASLAAFAVLYRGSAWFSRTILTEPRCILPMQLMAFTIPFSTLHICITAYYYGRRQTAIPAGAQLLEQTSRVLAAWCVYRMTLHVGCRPGPMVAAVAALISEAVSLSFLLYYIRRDLREGRCRPAIPGRISRCVRTLLVLSLPLTANRIILNLLKSLETILIPYCLRLSGSSASEALATYGILTGMALPLLLFPSTITHAVSVMLLPAVAESHALGQKDRIRLTVEKTLRYGLFLGILCFGLFFLYGDAMGILLFNSAEAGRYIAVLSFICPFMYLSSTLSSIITGLGKTTLYFLQSLAGLTMRILFVWFAIPRFGILGYLWGLLANEIILVLLCSLTLYRAGLLIFNPLDSLLKPFSILLIAAGCSRAPYLLFPPLSRFPLAALLLSCTVLCAIYVLFLNFFHIIHFPRFWENIMKNNKTL